MAKINIKGLDKKEILRRLYNNSRPIGMGWLQATSEEMTYKEAKKIIKEEGLEFDYLKGRVMKIDLIEDSFDPWLYDRDNGEGKAKEIIDGIR